MQFNLSRLQIQKLELKYRQVRSQVTTTIAIRILVVLTLVKFGNAALVTEIYQLYESTVRRYFRLYQEGGIDCLLEIHYQGRQSYLTEEQKEYIIPKRIPMSFHNIFEIFK
ncbi:MAG: helix-turn-helix domain-containing protein [Planctomycetaceae bacterium]|jgi:hypothetical protein|nr:helix-turn-helix domain-containing protein [Planctomycetaceae bacterium]